MRAIKPNPLFAPRNRWFIVSNEGTYFTRKGKSSSWTTVKQMAYCWDSEEDALHYAKANAIPGRVILCSTANDPMKPSARVAYYPDPGELAEDRWNETHH
jgi:hypothetical protein